jgi:hypothetical protein
MEEEAKREWWWEKNRDTGKWDVEVEPVAGKGGAGMAREGLMVIKRERGRGNRKRDWERGRRNRKRDWERGRRNRKKGWVGIEK